MGGDWVELQALYRATYQRALLLIGGDRYAAEDAAQEAVTRLLGQRTGVITNPRAWLLQVVSRLAYDTLRRRGREIVVSEPPEQITEFGDPARQALHHEEASQVRRTLAELPARDRTLLLLRHQGLAYKEIAHVIGCRPSSIGTLLVRAERRFKARYEALVADSSR
jgi:RNA polymerase sigma-70 factor (ECF subfamily)